jgi:hypothetical protein
VKYYQFCFFRDVAEESIRNEAMELRTNKPKYIYLRRCAGFGVLKMKQQTKKKKWRNKYIYIYIYIYM